MPPKFIPNGDRENDYITIDGHIDWAVIPAGTIDKVNIDMPIRLRLGNDVFGLNHINKRHGHWLKKYKTDACNMLWKKLSLYGGKFYTTQKKSKMLLHIVLNPEALISLEKKYDKDTKEHFFSVVTIYQQRPKDINNPNGIYDIAFRNPHVKVLRPMG